MTTGTEIYYERRAVEYDEVYAKPERQNSIAELRQYLGELLTGGRVLELACGTGFWTQSYVDSNTRVTATDVNNSTLEVARNRRRWPDHADFRVCEAFDLKAVPGTFDTALAGFLWSHIPLDRRDGLLASLAGRLEPGSLIVLADNRYVEGSNHPIARTDQDGNTYQRCPLNDGTTWEVLKNFPTSKELTKLLSRFGTDIEVREFEYFWCATLRTPDRPRQPASGVGQ